MDAILADTRRRHDASGGPLRPIEFLGEVIEM
jgi:hypothetical protein